MGTIFVPTYSNITMRYYKQKVYSIIENRIGLNTKEYFMEKRRGVLGYCEICFTSSRVTENFKFYKLCHTIYYKN